MDRESELFEQWWKTRSPESRHALTLYHSSWIRSMAKNVYFSYYVEGTELADYVHYATVGYLEALDKFDPRYETPFQFYAEKRIRGAILNAIPRFSEDSAQSNNRRRRLEERANSLWEEENPVDDALQELADFTLGITLGHLLEEVLAPQEQGTEGVYYFPENLILMAKDLNKAIQRLDSKEQQVLRYHYFQQLPFAEISELLGVTIGRISQVHKSALAKLADRFRASGASLLSA